MPPLLDIPSKYPSAWLAVYGCGCIMCIATVAHVMGTTAAGYLGGFLAIAGTFGYETITRRLSETELSGKISNIEHEQSRIALELARTRTDVDTMKDDMVQASKAFMTDKNKTAAARTVLKSFERMGTRGRAAAPAFMPSQAPANTQAATGKELRAQKYKDILMNSKEARDNAVTEDMMPDYTDQVMIELIHNAVQNDKIEIFAQPIVKLPSRRLQYLELFARIRAKSGVYLAAAKYRSLAEKEVLIQNVDHLLLNHVIDTIRKDNRHDLKLGYFINISSHSLKDKMFMNDLLEFVRSRRDLCDRLILELQEDDFRSLAPPVQRIIDGLTHLGCQISLDNIRGNINADEFAELGVTFIKYNAQKMVELCQSYEGEMNIARMKSSLDRSGVTLILEKLESNNELKELLDFDVELGEGYLFGRPDLEIAYRPKRVA